jgi:hypothetical protein
MKRYALMIQSTIKRINKRIIGQDYQHNLGASSTAAQQRAQHAKIQPTITSDIYQP